MGRLARDPDHDGIGGIGGEESPSLVRSDGDSALSSADVSWCRDLAGGGPFEQGSGRERQGLDRGTWIIEAGNLDLYGGHFADDALRALGASRELVESLRGEVRRGQDEIRERDEEIASLGRDLDLQSSALEDMAGRPRSRDAENVRLKCQVSALGEAADQVRVFEWIGK